ncbi:hypothetical protein ASG29_03635 [Sphingomonas sp. Leaf412]|uniref:PAS domain-containing protein n=1 Tax=Sphingomonas sp. Leaf412 TaxID=1736370 RepID=UPI0006FC7037|nr:PAS domain-containing protein [Sphingomonas sp. Leaf412]KQT35214.1 hypothetical protein ASG29_03635 [Sphingomonas sp. Leaf412]
MDDEAAGGMIDDRPAFLATVLDQSHDCIKLLSLDAVIRYVNRQGALAIGVASPRDLVGRPYLARWPADLHPAVNDALDAARAGGLGRFTGCRPRPDGLPGWWDVTVSPVRAATGDITHIATIARDKTAEVMEHDRVQAISLEMRHRLKNAMTIASGIVTLSAAGRPDVAEFAQEIVARLGHLASVQSAILDPASDGSLVRIVPALIQAYGERTALDFGALPDVRLGQQALQALALSFGELATNSLKYGALRHGGRVRIDGVPRDGMVEITWREETRFGAARPDGQGLHLIERLIRTAGGGFRREVDPDGMRATIVLPVI